ncbi:MAG TPA: pyruvate dehydrogenase complex dihydrolipoamide acetyltransferase, partial [Firmicutes bacterium]|nr:pyruvate dehydrogenase complex dihydrolipoamide acetyltransferase [Bacillota bacterium]
GYSADGIERCRDVNIGVALGLDAGVVVPVIHEVNRKSVDEIARELGEKTDRAKRGVLLAEDVQGSTFTLSNLGMFGVDEFQAILNAPDAAILAVGAVSKQAVVRGDVLAVGTVMTGTLTVDHRVADGVAAAKWMAAFADVLTNPIELVM